MSRADAAQLSETKKYFLNVGCGTSTDRSQMPPTLQSEAWHEVRIDPDSRVNPDVVAGFSDLHMIKADSVDAVWSSHSLEHMPLHEVRIALKEALRVLKPEGFLFLTLPDIEAIARLVAEGRLMDVVYESTVGPVTPLDMLYGHQRSQERGNHYMAHRTGFSSRSLALCLYEVGFAKVRVVHGNSYDLWALACTQDPPRRLIEELRNRRKRG